VTAPALERRVAAGLSLSWRALRGGLGWTLGAEIGSRALAYGAAILAIRLLGRELYGGYAYALNLLSIALLANGLGVHMGVLQLASRADSEARARALLRYGLGFGWTVNALLSAGLAGTALLAPLPIEGSRPVLLALAGVPLAATAYESVVAYLRARLRHRAFAILRLAFGAACLAGVASLGTRFGVEGVVAARYLAYGAALLAGAALLRRGAPARREALPAGTARELRRHAVFAAGAAATSEMLYVADTFLLGWLVPDARVVAGYRAATLLPYALNFVPLAFVAYAYPHFARSADRPGRWKAPYRALVAGLAVVQAALTLPLYLAAPALIEGLFGADYGDAVTPFRVLLIGSFAAGALRIPAGNLLASLGRVRLNLGHAAVALAANLVLDVWWIRAHGAVGAAWATTTILCVTGIVANAFVWREARRT